MRDPDQLPRVLQNLLDHPGLRNLLKQPKALVIYLDKQGWTPLPEEPETEDEDSEEVQAYYRAMDRWEQEQMEYGEILEAVEQKLARLELTPQEKQTLKEALTQTCPECQETLQVLMPTFARA